MKRENLVLDVKGRRYSVDRDHHLARLGEHAQRKLGRA